MRPAPLGVALAALAALPPCACLPAAHADGTISYDNTNFGPDNGADTANADTANADTTDASYPYEGQSGFVVDGLIRRVDAGNDRIVVFGDDNRRYNVDDYNADIRLRGQNADPGDLARGMRVRVSGRLLGVAFVAADLVRVLPPDDADADNPPLTAITPASPLAPVTLVPLDAPAAPPAPLDEGPGGPPVPAAPAVDGRPVDVDAVVTDLAADGRHITLLDPTDAHLTADTLGTDIILPGAARAGAFSDLTRGLHVRLIGTQAADGSVQADRLRIQPDPAPAPVAAVAADPNPAPSVAVDVDLSQYTGILIDARGLPGVMRSPAPTIVGANGDLLYPDRAHVPTPDEVQDESIVRYYHTLDDAEQGVAGPHPLILTAAAVVGPAADGLQLADGDAGLLQALDKRLRFSRTWKVGFLIPADR